MPSADSTYTGLNSGDQPGRELRVAILPDSFKGSATAQEVASAMERGAQRAAKAFDTPVVVQALPFADGGEGTLDAISSAWGVAPKTVEVTDALGRPSQGKYATSTDSRTGVIEAAEANGLPTISDLPPEPLRASTHGVADLVRAALDDGCEDILLCIGGSASTDGGAGLLQGLGARFLDAAGQDLPAGGAALRDLASIDLTGLDPRAGNLRWRIACDVINPLLGPQGAAAVFGPQKGASEADVQTLDAGLARLADVLAELTGDDLRELPGMGAAGGMPIVLASLFDAEILPGGELIAQTLGAHAMLESADFVLTGEGRLDSQSLGGKVVDTICRIISEDTALCVIAGSVELSADQLREAGIAAFSIATGPEDLETLRASAVPRVEATAEQILRVYLSGLTLSRGTVNKS